MEVVISKSDWIRAAKFPQWYKSLTNSFRRFLHSRILTDVVFHCKNHKQVIFKNLFYSVLLTGPYVVLNLLLWHSK